jgi:hypothetical protein
MGIRHVLGMTPASDRYGGVRRISWHYLGYFRVQVVGLPRTRVRLCRPPARALNAGKAVHRPLNMHALQLYKHLALAKISESSHNRHFFQVLPFPGSLETSLPPYIYGV